MAPHPYGLILNHEAGVAVTANSGIEPLSISIIRNIYSDQPEVQQIPPGSTTDEGVLASVFMGLAISPDGKTVYVAGGQENKIYLFDLTVGSFGSIFKTFWNILGLPYLNQYDAGAMDMADLFTTEPDFTAYDALPADRRIFDPEKAMDPLDENFDWTAVEDSPMIDNPADMLKESRSRNVGAVQTSFQSAKRGEAGS